jgi:hypothetical protein
MVKPRWCGFGFAELAKDCHTSRWREFAIRAFCVVLGLDTVFYKHAGSLRGVKRRSNPYYLPVNTITKHRLQIDASIF